MTSRAARGRAVTGCVAAVLAAACVSQAEGTREAWEIPIGSEHVRSFPAEFIPGFYTYTALAVKGRAHAILVVPVHLYIERKREAKARETEPSHREQGGRYVFLLDRKTGRVESLTRDQFLELELLEEDLPAERPSAYPQLQRAGAQPRFVLPMRRGGTELVAAESLDSEEKTRLTFGLPSLIPFMGRQNFFERTTFYSGTVYLEIFDTRRPLRPLVQLKQRFRGRTSVPLASESAAWVQGAEVPSLVLTDPGEPGRWQPCFLLVSAG